MSHSSSKPEASAVKPTRPPVDAPGEIALRLLAGDIATPHAVLGAHPAQHEGVPGIVVRARYPNARAMACVTVDGQSHAMALVSGGLHQVFLPGASLPLSYQLAITLPDGRVTTGEDPYRFLPTLGEIDLHLIGEGRHQRLWEVLGAQPRMLDGVEGTAFAVWAPNARAVSVVGPFNAWDARIHPMRKLGGSGVWELFIPAVGAGALYKFEIRTPGGRARVKTDPMARFMEQSPGHASIVNARDTYTWRDAEWMAARAERDPVREPMLIYEVHLGSWMRVATEENRSLTYREIAPRLAEHCTRLGFTHIELLPVLEHPFGGSWGYQVGGYYAPTSRYGSPDDFRFFVDTMHQAGISVLLDWVPAHFPKDDWALRRFDGTPCYEHEDPRLAEHPEWGTLIFNYGRHEVRNFLLANALYWIEEFHLDGLRVDAVASMLYLDYGREAGQWLRNRLGGRENLEAVAFLRQLNYLVRSQHPGVVTIAEESTTWPKVTHPISEGGLGFTFKWNMGWMHDTLTYFRVDPLFRRGAHDQLTFAMMYEYSERFVNPISHDEVVHLKRSMLEKMPGDTWRKFANLRALIGYSVTRPGKSMFFMGIELATHREWNHDASLEWHLSRDPKREGLMAFMAALGALYRAHSCFWRRDHEPAGFSWIDVGDREQSVVSYVRRDGAHHAVVVLNLTPVPRLAYRIGVPAEGSYRYALSSDDATFGGSGHERPETVATDAEPYHGFPHSVQLTLPPLSVLVLLPEPGTVESATTRRAVDAIPPGSERAIPAPTDGITRDADPTIVDAPRRGQPTKNAPRVKARKAASETPLHVKAKPSTATKPAKANKSGTGSKPLTTGEAAKASKPSKPSKPSKASKPSIAAKPNNADKPARTAAAPEKAAPKAPKSKPKPKPKPPES